MKSVQERPFCGIRGSLWVLAVLGLLCVFSLYQLPGRDETGGPAQIPSSSRFAAVPVSSKNENAEHPPSSPSDKAKDHHIRFLLQELTDTDTQIRLSAIDSLKREPLDDSIIPALIACLSDSEPMVRAAAATELARYRFSAMEAVPQLKILAQSDPDESVRFRAKEALYNIRLHDYPLF